VDTQVVTDLDARGERRFGDDVCLVGLSQKVKGRTVYCGYPRDSCRRRSRQTLQAAVERRGSLGIYQGIENRNGTVVDAIADTFVSFEDHSAHRAANTAVLAALASSPQKRRAEEVLKPRAAALVTFVTTPTPALGPRAKKLAGLTAHLPASPRASIVATTPIGTKPPPSRPTLKSAMNDVAPTAGVPTILKTGSTAVHPKSTSGLLAMPP
jgi:hypothetical protein